MSDEAVQARAAGCPLVPAHVVDLSGVLNLERVRSVTSSLVSEDDLATLRLELGRPLRGVHAVVHRCADGHPTVVETEPRLPDGTPFPTLYYLTCPRAVAAASTLESRGVMTEMTERLAEDPGLATAYRNAHDDYLARRERIGHVAEIAGVSAGGMPSRVKCLHVLVAHSLAAGRGVNPMGDEALDRMAALDEKPWTTATCTWRAA